MSHLLDVCRKVTGRRQARRQKRSVATKMLKEKQLLCLYDPWDTKFNAIIFYNRPLEIA